MDVLISYTATAVVVRFYIVFHLQFLVFYYIAFRFQPWVLGASQATALKEPLALIWKLWPFSFTRSGDYISMLRAVSAALPPTLRL